MLEITLSIDAPVWKLQKCLVELEPKVMWSQYDAKKRMLVVDSTNCNTKDIEGTLLATIGVDMIDEIREI